MCGEEHHKANSEASYLIDRCTTLDFNPIVWSYNYALVVFFKTSAGTWG